MNDSFAPSHPTRYGVLRFAGPDAHAFLQGQVSNDIALLQPGQPLLAGLHNPQGRVLALLRLWPDETANGAVLASLPHALLDSVAGHLRRFVLRAKVQISDVSSEHATTAEVVMDESGREADQVAAGLPEVYATTSGEFVAQMLNLDCLGAISWNKGCYTGQEVIARAHYRGQVKRRMRRYACTQAGDLPAPGSTWTTSDGLSVRVVRSARRVDDECELLGVAPLDAKSMDELPLPYALPAPALSPFNTRCGIDTP